MKATRRDGTIDLHREIPKALVLIHKYLIECLLHKEWDCIYLKH